MKNSLELLEKKIKYKFKNTNLLELSLTHKSFDKINNNEKLEFLGDRVLGLIISKNLLKIYKEKSEGIIDKKYANLVNKNTCAEIADKIELKKFIRLGESSKKLQRSNERILSDCLEALIGAIFLDSDIKIVEKFILKVWEKYLIKTDFILIDPKTKLQEYCLKKYKVLPKYSLNKKQGPQHSPVFNVNVEIPNFKKSFGKGNSIKKAQQQAAKLLLKSLNII